MVGLLGIMLFLSGGTALRESATFDEIAHVGAGLSYWQRLDLRLNPEHPPLGKLLAALPLALRGTYADYSSPSWNLAADFFPALIAEWIFGDAVLGRWNAWQPTLLWARLPMLILTLLLGWFLYSYGSRFGGTAGGLLCLAAYVTTPTFLIFGPLVITDLPVTLFSVIAIWQLGEIWATPTRRNAMRFGLAFGASLLSKFTGLLLLPVILALFLQTRFWPTGAQPREKEERRKWRRARWACVFRSLAWAAALVYAVYFVFAWNQPDDALNRVAGGSWAWLIRRPLMPVWLYCRGLLVMLMGAARPTYLFGHSYPHGVPYYFPLVFALKSTVGFLLLLLLAASAALLHRKRGTLILPKPVRPHWRVLLVAFFVILTVCLLARLDISLRHFMLPIALLILMLAPLPQIIHLLPHRRLWQIATAAFTVCCFVPLFLAYPFLFPFVNSLAFGRPAYFVFNGSNVDWNQSLPEIARFVRENQLSAIALDWQSLSDPTLIVPEAQSWDCQAPTDRDAGQWVAVAAVSILENHNCGYLLKYPHIQLAGGASYVFKLPTPIPPAGTPGGPPFASERRSMYGMPIDLRGWVVNVERHPERLPAELKMLMMQFHAPG